MTYQGTRVSLILIERFFTMTRTAIFTLAMAFALYAVVKSFPALHDGLAQSLPRIKQVEVQGVKVVLDPASVAAAGENSTLIPADMKVNLPDDILGLKPAWVVRLLYVGDKDNKCEYEYADEKMKASVAADKHLLADGLIRMEPDARVRVEALKAMREAKARGEEWTIGEPRACYQTELTARGRNVKTALAEFLSAGFAAAAASPEARAQQRMRVAQSAPR